MFRLSGLFFLILAIGCGTLLFLTSQSVQKTERKLSKIGQSNRTEIETLRVLSAEWDYLNRPERLESLTSHNLDLDATLADGNAFVSSVGEVPEPVMPVLPKIKPAFLQHVSTQRPIQENSSLQKPATINKVESQNFDKLLDGLSERGQE